MRIRLNLGTLLRFAVSAVLLLSEFYFIGVVVPEFGSKTENRILPDLYPAWYAAHAVMNGQNPYSAEATREIQRGMYGDFSDLRQVNEQRFAYPLFAVLPIIPLTLMSFSAAQQMCLWGGIVLTIGTAWLWCQSVGCKFDVIVCAMILAALPVSLGIILRQPTVYYLFLLALTAYLFKIGKYGLSGIVGALATGKPQLALFVLVPLVILIMSRWNERKRFMVGYVIAVGALLGISFALQPSWLQEWLGAVGAYQKYGRVFEFYNLALLTPVCLWLWKNRKWILSRGLPAQLLLLAPSALVGAGYCLVMLSCLFHELVPLPFFFFNRGGLLLALEAPIIAFLIWEGWPDDQIVHDLKRSTASRSILLK